jgi:aminopeptidase 2
VTEKFSFRAINTIYDVEKQTVKFVFQQELAAKTTATLHIEYTGSLNDRMTGFHRSSYKGKDGKTRYVFYIIIFQI